MEVEKKFTIACLFDQCHKIIPNFFLHILRYIFATTRYTLHILYSARIPSVLAFLLQLFVCHLVKMQLAMKVKRTMLYRFVSIFYVERCISYGLHRRTFDTMLSCIYTTCGPLYVISSALNLTTNRLTTNRSQTLESSQPIQHCERIT
ncbi:unnamed protein product [Ixodes persulcatus]